MCHALSHLLFIVQIFQQKAIVLVIDDLGSFLVHRTFFICTKIKISPTATIGYQAVDLKSAIAKNLCHVVGGLFVTVLSFFSIFQNCFSFTVTNGTSA